LEVAECDQSLQAVAQAELLDDGIDNCYLRILANNDDSVSGQPVTNVSDGIGIQRQVLHLNRWSKVRDHIEAAVCGVG
jgi:hypothetical protein